MHIYQFVRKIANAIIGKGTLFVENNIVQSMMYSYLELREYRKQFDVNWNKYWNLYIGEHWGGIERLEEQSKPVLNFTLEAVDNAVATLMDTRLQPDAVCIDNRDIAQAVNNALSSMWKQGKMNTELSKTVMNMHIKGNGIQRVGIDSNGGLLSFDVDPVSIFTNEGALSLEDAEVVMYLINVPISKAMRMYPEHKDKIAENALVWDERLTKNDKINRGVSIIANEYVHYTDNEGKSREMDIVKYSEMNTDSTAISNASRSTDRTTICEMWAKDDNGKQTVATAIGRAFIGIVETPLPIPSVPFISFPYLPMSDKWLSPSFVQICQEMQITINKRLGQVDDMIRLNVAPPIIVDTEMLDIDDIGNMPDIVVPLKSNNTGKDISQSAYRLPSSPLQIDAIVAYINMIKTTVREILGVRESVSQGGKNPASGIAISEKTEALTIRPRQRSRYFEDCIVQLGEYLTAIILENIHLPNIKTSIGREVYDSIADNNSKNMDVSINGKVYKLKATRLKKIDGEIRIDIIANATRLFGHSEVAYMAVLLGDKGYIDKTQVKAILEQNGYPQIRSIAGGGEDGGFELQKAR